VGILLAVVVLILFLLAGLAIRSKIRKVRPWFEDSHYLELIKLAFSLRDAALENIDAQNLIQNDPRRSVTSKDILVIYTIEQARGLFYHHLSFSHAGGYLAFAAGGRFLYVMSSSLGILANLVGVAHTQNGIIHGGFLLAATEQRIYAERTVNVPPIEQIYQVKINSNKWFERFWKTNELLRSEDELLEKLSDNKSGMKWIL
jgi:hypothetical protein